MLEGTPNLTFTTKAHTSLASLLITKTHTISLIFTTETHHQPHFLTESHSLHYKTYFNINNNLKKLNCIL